MQDPPTGISSSPISTSPLQSSHEEIVPNLWKVVSNQVVVSFRVLNAHACEVAPRVETYCAKLEYVFSGSHRVTSHRALSLYFLGLLVRFLSCPRFFYFREP